MVCTWWLEVTLFTRLGQGYQSYDGVNEVKTRDGSPDFHGKGWYIILKPYQGTYGEQGDSLPWCKVKSEGTPS